MDDGNPLAAIIRRETLEEALRALTPEELAVAQLRVDGLLDAEIAYLLGISRTAVVKRMASARGRIAAQVPELASWLKGRRLLRPSWRRRRHSLVDSGWLDAEPRPSDPPGD